MGESEKSMREDSEFGEDEDMCDSDEEFMRKKKKEMKKKQKEEEE